jgi:hypothetical protein
VGAKVQSVDPTSETMNCVTSLDVSREYRSVFDKDVADAMSVRLHRAAPSSVDRYVARTNWIYLASLDVCHRQPYDTDVWFAVRDHRCREVYAVRRRHAMVVWHRCWCENPNARRQTVIDHTGLELRSREADCEIPRRVGRAWRRHCSGPMKDAPGQNGFLTDHCSRALPQRTLVQGGQHP